MALAILIRHAAPLVEPHVPATEWRLSADGRRGSESIAADLRRFSPAALASSPEPKAVETATIIGERLGLSVRVRQGLREHRRSAGFLPMAEFHANIRAVLENPSDVAFGHESADVVAARIEAEILRELGRALSSANADQRGNALLVTHGTAIACFLRKVSAVDAFAVWKSFALPAFVALEAPDFDIVDYGGMEIAPITENET